MRQKVRCVKPCSPPVFTQMLADSRGWVKASGASAFRAEVNLD